MEQFFCPNFVFMYFWNGHKYEMWPLLISNESCKKSGANWWSSIKFSSITFHWIVDSFFLHTYINISLSRWSHDTAMGILFLLRNVFLGYASSKVRKLTSSCLKKFLNPFCFASTLGLLPCLCRCKKCWQTLTT